MVLFSLKYYGGREHCLHVRDIGQGVKDDFRNAHKCCPIDTTMSLIKLKEKYKNNNILHNQGR